MNLICGVGKLGDQNVIGERAAALPAPLLRSMRGAGGNRSLVARHGGICVAAGGQMARVVEGIYSLLVRLMRVFEVSEEAF